PASKATRVRSDGFSNTSASVLPCNSNAGCPPLRHSALSACARFSSASFSSRERSVADRKCLTIVFLCFSWEGWRAFGPPDFSNTQDLRGRQLGGRFGGSATLQNPLFPASCGGFAATARGKRAILGRRPKGTRPPQTPPLRKSCQ